MDLADQVKLCLTCLQGHPLSEQEACSDWCRWRGLLLHSTCVAPRGAPQESPRLVHPSVQVGWCLPRVQGNPLSEQEGMLRLAELLELTVRSLNNLLERLHHSTTLYLLLSLDWHVSIQVYMIPAGLLVAATLLQVRTGVLWRRQCAWQCWLGVAGLQCRAVQTVERLGHWPQPAQL